MKNKPQTLILLHESAIINGKLYPPPRGKGCHIIIKDNRVFINGYECIDGKWKLTFRSFWHWLWG